MRPAPLALLLLALPACDGPSNPAADAGPDADADPDAGVPADAADWPAFRNPVDLDDLTLAQMASERLGVGDRVACDTCHALTRSRMTLWLTESEAADSACLGDLTPDSPEAALAVLDCFRSTTTEAWSPHRLGIYATGAGSPWFEALFQMAYGDGHEDEWTEWTGRVWMPRGAQAPLTAGEFDVVAEWFARGLPELETVIPEDTDPPGCTPSIDPAVAAHVTAMETAGWTAINRDAASTCSAARARRRPRTASPPTRSRRRRRTR
jgi:hypothetical protein